MSTTMLSSSSSGRRNVASTTMVAPCSFCAGPKTSPEKLCAIMMWSRTVTLNKPSLSFVVHQVTQGRELATRQTRHDLGQLAECRPPGDQCAEPVIVQEIKGKTQTLTVRAPAARPDATDLAAAHGQPPR